MTDWTPLIIVALSGAVSELVGIVQRPAPEVAPYQIVAVVGDDPLVAGAAARLGVPLLTGLEDGPPAAHVAATHARQWRDPGLAEAMEAGGHVPATLIHVDSTIGPWVTLGAGCVVSPGVRITGNVSVGDHCQLHTGVIVSHDDVLRDGVTLSPGVTLCGGVTVDAEATVFAGATVMPGRTIGAGAVVGAGALVNRDVAAGETVAGVPARPLA